MISSRALIADSSPLFREGLRTLLRQSRFLIVAECQSISEAMEQMGDAGDVNLVICSFQADAARSSLAAVTELRALLPMTKIIIIADKTIAPAVWWEAFHKSDAILSRDVTGKVLQRAIELVLLEQKFVFAHLLEVLAPNYGFLVPPVQLDPSEGWYVPEPGVEADELTKLPTPLLPARPADALPVDPEIVLSDRERQILQYLVRGYSNKVIARELDIAEATVKVHVKGLLRKLNAANRTQAAVWALSHGVMVSEPEILTAQ